MLRRFLSILCVIFVLGTSLAVGASAAVPLETSIYRPENYYSSDLNLEYIAFFDDDSGYLISFSYNPELYLDIVIDSNNFQFVFTNFDFGDQMATVTARNVLNGKLLTSSTFSVPGEGNKTVLFSSFISDKELLPFSDLKYYETFPDHKYTLDFNTINFSQNYINWSEPVSDGYLLSVLPEPVADNSNAYIVLQSAGGSARLLSFSWSLTDDALKFIDVQLWVDATGFYYLRIFNKNEFDIDFQWNMYDVSNGYFLDSGSGRVSSNLVSYERKNINVNISDYPSCSSYGIGFFNPYNFPVNKPSILWNFDRLNAEAIASGTLLLLNQLYAINRSLGDIEDLLILELMDLNYTLEQIYDILDRVYNAEPETYEQPSSDAVNEYLEDESAIYEVLPTGMVDNIDNALGSPDTVFDGNGAFGLIRSLMQGLAFNNTKINGLILFALAMGIAVLILGRRLNS